LKSALALLVLLGGAVGARAQQPVWRVFHQYNKDGTVWVLAENHSCVPITVDLSAQLSYMSSSVPLPAPLVVQPGNGYALLAVLTPTSTPYSFEYKAPIQVGIFSGQVPDAAYPYQLPFGPQVTWTWGLYNTVTGSPQFAGASYYFALPATTPVRAARNGVVVNVEQHHPKNRARERNFIIVQHADGSYAWYGYLKAQSASVRIGQQVATGQVLALSSTAKEHLPMGFAVYAPGLGHCTQLPVKFGSPLPPATLDEKGGPPHEQD